MNKTAVALCQIGLCALAVSSAKAFTPGELEIWIGSDKGYQGLAAVGEQFEADTGIPVRVRTDNDWDTEDLGDVAARFSSQAATLEGPDIVIWAHDRFGSWLNEGLLAQVHPAEDVFERVADFAWNGVQHGDGYYGYPINTEAVSLIYNQDLIDQPPTTYEEIIALDHELRAEGKRALVLNWSEPYFIWHLVTSGGGYSWGFDDGEYLLDDVGFASEGAKDGIRMLRRLIEEGVVELDDDYGVMDDAFASGEAAMVINGPWGWNDYREVDFALAPLPAISSDHEPGVPFVGLLAAGVNAVSPNRELAQQFLEDYLMTEEGFATVDADRPLGAVVLDTMADHIERDPRLQLTLELAEAGELMPAVPEIGRFWSLWTFELEGLATGESEVDATLDSMAERLARLSESMAWRRKYYPVN